MEYDIEKILYTFEDDYNPSSMVPGPRNMYNQGQLVQPNADGSRPGYSGKTAKKAILNLPDEGEIDLDKLAKKHKVSTSLISQYRNRYKPNLTSVKKVKQPTMLTKEQQKIFRQYKKLHTGTQSDSSIRFKIKNNIINADTITKLQKGIPLTATDKDKTALDADTIKKIKQKIKLKPGQKWNFYNPETNPTGHTYGIKKSDNVNLYDKARTIGKPGRLETSIKKSKEKYEKIKADPKLLAAAQKDRKEKYLANREEILENQRLKYETDKQWRKAKLEWSRIDKIKNPEKYKKRMNEWLAKRGQFPPGNNYKESVWRDMFRSSQKEGQTRFLLVDENGNQLTQDKFPKVDGKVRWDRNANYKNVKFYDTVTKQFVKLDNSIKGKGITFEKYLNQKSVGGKGAYENAINGYKNKDTIKNITFTDSKGKNIRIGTVMSDKLKQGSNDFIKSGVVVQHPDIDNAFWKNEVSTTSSNDTLNYLEQTLKRELRNAGNNTMLRNKALTKFKTKINNLPGGITKVMEGITYGNAPSSESVVAQVGKDFKIDRFKNFPKDSKSIQNAMLEFAGTITDKCKIGNAEGGRIGFKTGSADCLRIAKEGLEKNLFKGGGTEVQRGLIQRIISGGGKMAISMLNPKELIRLKNLVGPGALGLMGAYEVGSITDDVLRLNKPLDEALAGNWLTKSFLPYSEEFAKQKNLLQSGQLTGDQKEYALEMMKMENFIKEGKRIEGLEANKLVEGTLDDDFTFTSDKDMNKAYSDLFGRFSRLKPYAYEQGITGRSLENEAAMNEYLDAQTARTGASKIFGGPQPMVNKAPRPTNMGRGPMTEKGKMKLDFNIPGYTSYDKAYTPSDDEILNIYKQQGYVHPRFGQLEPGEGTKVRMGLASQEGNRSIYGSKFMEGGIASLNVNKK